MSTQRRSSEQASVLIPQMRTSSRKGGKFTRVVVEAGIVKVATPISEPATVEKWADSCAPVIQSWARAGCTTVFDAGIVSISNSNNRLMIGVTTSPICTPLPVRFLGAFSINSAEGVLPGDTPPVSIGNVTVRSVKYRADGSIHGFTAAVNEPYINNLNPKGGPWGTLNYPTDKLKDLIPKGMSKGWQLLVHSNSDRATDQSLDCYEVILPNGKDEKMMHRIEHFTVTSSNQVSRAASLGLGISHTIGNIYY